MMERQRRDQGKLFYEFHLDDRIPQNHSSAPDRRVRDGCTGRPPQGTGALLQRDRTSLSPAAARATSPVAPTTLSTASVSNGRNAVAGPRPVCANKLTSAAAL